MSPYSLQSLDQILRSLKSLLLYLLFYLFSFYNQQILLYFPQQSLLCPGARSLLEFGSILLWYFLFWSSLRASSRQVMSLEMDERLGLGLVRLGSSESVSWSKCTLETSSASDLGQNLSESGSSLSLIQIQIYHYNYLRIMSPYMLRKNSSSLFPNSLFSRYICSRQSSCPLMNSVLPIVLHSCELRIQMPCIIICHRQKKSLYNSGEYKSLSRTYNQKSNSPSNPFQLGSIKVFQASMMQSSFQRRGGKVWFSSAPILSQSCLIMRTYDFHSLVQVLGIQGSWIIQQASSNPIRLIKGSNQQLHNYPRIKFSLEIPAIICYSSALLTDLHRELSSGPNTIISFTIIEFWQDQCSLCSESHRREPTKSRIMRSNQMLVSSSLCLMSQLMKCQLSQKRMRQTKGLLQLLNRAPKLIMTVLRFAQVQLPLAFMFRKQRESMSTLNSSMKMLYFISQSYFLNQVASARFRGQSRRQFYWKQIKISSFLKFLSSFLSRTNTFLREAQQCSTREGFPVSMQFRQLYTQNLKIQLAWIEFQFYKFLKLILLPYTAQEPKKESTNRFKIYIIDICRKSYSLSDSALSCRLISTLLTFICLEQRNFSRNQAKFRMRLRSLLMP